MGLKNPSGFIDSRFPIVLLCVTLLGISSSNAEHQSGDYTVFSSNIEGVLEGKRNVQIELGRDGPEIKFSYSNEQKLLFAAVAVGSLLVLASIALCCRCLCGCCCTLKPPSNNSSIIYQNMSSPHTSDTSGQILLHPTSTPKIVCSRK